MRRHPRSQPRLIALLGCGAAAVALALPPAAQAFSIRITWADLYGIGLWISWPGLLLSLLLIWKRLDFGRLFAVLAVVVVVVLPWVALAGVGAFDGHIPELLSHHHPLSSSERLLRIHGLGSVIPLACTAALLALIRRLPSHWWPR